MFEPKSRVGPYMIVAPIGAGGMGQVYRAHDERLGRDVAVKVLPESSSQNATAKARFEREGRAIAAMSHPNILSVYDFGEHDGNLYIVTELLEGEDLRSRMRRAALPWRRALEIAAAICEGLSAAHEKGIIHRDLKPENIFITSDGRVKILDFGLARVEQLVGSDAATTPAHTDPGTVLGTIGYMSPEQVRGEEATARSDIFSLGCILYEMANRRRAFARDSAADTMVAILREDPPEFDDNTEVPSQVRELVVRCLEKDPKLRFQSARDLALMLRSISSGSTPIVEATGPRPSRTRVVMVTAACLLVLMIIGAGWLLRKPKTDPITTLAVLPFANLGRSADTEFLGEGIAESIINTLALVKQLHVTPRALSFRYKAETSDLAEAARNLHARAILTGSVLQRGEKILINTELLDVQTNERLWGAQYVRNFTDIFVVQDQIAKEISNSLRVRLSPSDVAIQKRRYTDDSAAYRLFLEATYHRRKQTIDELKKSIELYDQAIAHDASYAPAYEGIAAAYGFLNWLGGVPAGVNSGEKIRAAAKKAIELDDSMAEAHLALSIIVPSHQEKERELKRALELDPQHDETYFWYFLFLEQDRRFEEAERLLQKARTVENSNFPFVDGSLMELFSFQKDCTRAMHQAQLLLDNPSVWRPGLLSEAHDIRAQCHEQSGNLHEAVREYMVSEGATPQEQQSLQAAFDRGGMPEFWRERLRQVQQAGVPVGFYDLAIYQMHAGDRTAALGSLVKAVEAKDKYLRYLNSAPTWDPLREDPRFQAMLRDLHFP